MSHVPIRCCVVHVHDHVLSCMFHFIRRLALKRLIELHQKDYRTSLIDICNGNPGCTQPLIEACFGCLLDLSVGFLLLQYAVLFTVDSLSLLYLHFIS